MHGFANPKRFLALARWLTPLCLIAGLALTGGALAWGPGQHGDLSTTNNINLTNNGLLGIAMWLGRFFVIVPVLAVAGSLAAKRYTPATSGSFPTTGGLWVGLLVGIILIMGGLTFLPSLALGPIADHLSMIAGQRF